MNRANIHLRMAIIEVECGLSLRESCINGVLNLRRLGIFTVQRAIAELLVLGVPLNTAQELLNVS